MKHYNISVRPFGASAILVEWPNEVDEAILQNIVQFQNLLQNEGLNSIEWEFVPAYNSLTIINNKKPINFESTSKQIKTFYKKVKGDKQTENYLWRLPVCYDLDFALDLSLVANALNITIDEVIKLHTNATYTVFGIGFLPGFMYLGGLHTSLETPRKEIPRQKVEKGAVGLAGKQTGIYPQESPGGWNIIGNCSVPIFDAKNKNPCLVSVGDKIEFYQISRAEYKLHKIEQEVGIYKYEKSKI